MKTKQPTFKRNQLDEALHALFSGPSFSAHERLDSPVPSAFRTRIKRLLELDRALVPVGASTYAFHEGAAPGKGHDVTYSDYRAFNVAIALELVRFGCKQREVVARILELEPKLREAFERSSKRYQTHGRATTTSTSNTDNARRAGEPGEIRIYLIVSQVERQTAGSLSSDDESSIEFEIVDGSGELQKRLHKLLPGVCFGVFVLEVSEFAGRLTELLKAKSPSRRGR